MRVSESKCQLHNAVNGWFVECVERCMSLYEQHTHIYIHSLDFGAKRTLLNQTVQKKHGKAKYRTAQDNRDLVQNKLRLHLYACANVCVHACMNGIPFHPSYNTFKS